MRLTEETIREVLQMELQEAYEYFLVLKIENPELGKYYDQIRYGIREEFDIHEIFDGFVDIKPKQGIVRIRGTTVTLQDYRNEIEERKSLIKNAIITHVTEQNDIYKSM